MPLAIWLIFYGTKFHLYPAFDEISEYLCFSGIILCLLRNIFKRFQLDVNNTLFCFSFFKFFICPCLQYIMTIFTAESRYKYITHLDSFYVTFYSPFPLLSSKIKCIYFFFLTKIC